MASSKALSTQQPAASDPAYRKVYRAFFALCILLASLALSLWFSLCPTGANDAACPDQGSSLVVFAAFRAMNPPLMQLLLFLNLIIPYLYRHELPRSFTFNNLLWTALNITHHSS